MHPMICFVVLTVIVGIDGQLLENVAAPVGIERQLENVAAPKRRLCGSARREKMLRHMKLPKVFVEVLDVGRCRNAVKKHCPCGWAKCVWRANYSCTNELTKCCPVNYDLKCCESEKDFIVEVLVMRKCRKTVNKHCLCGWAKCVRREGYSCTNELTKCCAVNTFASNIHRIKSMEKKQQLIALCERERVEISKRIRRMKPDEVTYKDQNAQIVEARAVLNVVAARGGERLTPQTREIIVKLKELVHLKAKRQRRAIGWD
ncbi:hypothetical protein GPALN_011621 [Globodera pallida]|nr:hypothetical protein GPALN_011621 [Globodera pallida]